MASEDKPVTVKEALRAAKCNENVTEELREQMIMFMGDIPNYVGFAQTVSQRVLTTEMYLYRREEEPNKWEAKTISECVVTPDMTNYGGMMHGGCTSYIVDICTSVALALLQFHLGKVPLNVSQALNVMFHTPAPTGAKLKIISRTIVSGSRIQSTQCEIYDSTNSRLVATGTHTKMETSIKPPPQSKL
ncbi:hypothetical protein EIP91_003510 [Steccherinum ochraceum]|uniref:Thioesterase domain-containing protein n=1 Tax=Steccherinum ochraceum TaxID=92696 RepID=A0A4R0RWX0_9APHY|nr:hypothetical protein EIP91_003510 [Steccherinum ochraceum]